MMWEYPQVDLHVICYKVLELVARHQQITIEDLHKLDPDFSLNFHLEKLQDAGKIKIEGRLVTFLSR